MEIPINGIFWHTSVNNGDLFCCDLLIFIPFKMNVQRVLISLSVLLSICVFSHSQFVPLKGGLPFKEPMSLSSSDGVLDMSLEVEIGDITVDWLTIPRRLYNNTFPSPTIRLKAGDLWHLHVLNSLQDPDYIAEEHGVFTNPNTTNMHTHGLHISSEEPQDSQKVTIPPGGSYDYHYEINAEQPGGTNWYHPHYHGSNHFQTQSGMHGMIVVEDDADEEIAAVDDVIIVTSMFNYMDDGDSFIEQQEEMNDFLRLDKDLEDWLYNEDNGVLHILVNGLLEPVMEMDPGVWKRLRIVNTGGLHAMALSITPDEDDVTKECQYYEIALDGIYLREPRLPPHGRSLVVAGGRLDVLVRCPHNGTYQLTSNFMDEDEESLGEHPMYNGVMMTLNVTGNDVTEEFTLPKLPQLPWFYDDLMDVPADQIAGRFAVEVTPGDSMNREDFVSMEPESWRYKAEVGTIQEMILTNVEWEDSHPIHMHINHMQVISYNEYTGPIGDGRPDGGEWTLFDQSGEKCTYQHPLYESDNGIEWPGDEALTFIGHEKKQQGNGSIGYLQIGEWRDVIIVPPLSNITVRFRAHEYTGPVLIHCHLTADADEGMMEVIGIVPKGSDLTANVTSNGAYPWSCMENEPIGEYAGGKASSLQTSIITLVLSLSLYLMNNLL